MGLFDRFKKKSISKDSEQIIDFSEFVRVFEPEDKLIKPKEEEIEEFAKVLPIEVLEFWRKYGFGNYGNGIVKVVNPLDYMENFYDWIGEQDFSKIPLLITGFGDVFYYRKLQGDAEDVCLLDIHYRNITVCSYSLKEFFETYIVNEDNYNKNFKKKLFKQAYDAKGKITASQIYYFVPALALGGKESVDFIDKGDSNVHQSLLLQLGK